MRTCLMLLPLLAGMESWDARADDRVEARRHFQSGMALIQQKEYLEGVAELEEAYRLLPHPSVLYNIGRAYLDAGRIERGIEALERYLQSDPPDREAVQALLIQARQTQARAAQAAPGEPPAPLPRPPSGQDRRPVGEAQTDTVAAVTDGAPQGTAEPADQRPFQLSSSELKRLAAELEVLSSHLLRAAGETSPGGEPAAGTAEPGRLSSEEDGQITPGDTGLLATSSTFSRSGESKVDPYAPQVVTSARFSQSPLESVSAMTVIPGDEIRRSGLSSWVELLRRVPGLSVMALSPSDYNVGIRGFNAVLSNKVLVLVDGRSVYMDFVGATLWPMLPISPSDIDRIEIIRGPGAALYGAGAFSGVVNIITRSPGAADDRPSVTLRAGIPDWTEANVHLTGRRASSAFRASGGIEQIERWAVEIDPSRPDYEILAEHPDHASRVRRMDARFDQRLGDQGTLSLSGGLAEGQVEFTAIGALRDYLVDGQYGYLRADLVTPTGLSLRGFWNHLDMRAAPWSTPVGSVDLTSTPRSDVLDLEAQWFKRIEGKLEQRWNVGVGYRYKTIDWTWLENGGASENHFSLFVQDELRPRPDLIAVLSLRLDPHPLLAGNPDASPLDRFPLSPRAAAVYRLNEFRSLRATVGTAFRNPTFLESYNALPLASSNDAFLVLNRGNLSLLPERILSLELGYLEQPASGLYELEASLYYNRVRALIGLSDVTPYPQMVYNEPQDAWYLGETRFVNLPERYESFGLELAGRVFPLPGLEAYANLGLNPVLTSSEVDGAVVRAPDRSTSLMRFSLGARYRVPSGFSVGGDVHYASSQEWQIRSFDETGAVQIETAPLPGFLWLGLRAGYRSRDGRMEVGLEGNNLLSLLVDLNGTDTSGSAGVAPEGTHREYPLGQPVPGAISGTMSVRF